MHTYIYIHRVHMCTCTHMYTHINRERGRERGRAHASRKSREKSGKEKRVDSLEQENHREAIFIAEGHKPYS